MTSLHDSHPVPPDDPRDSPAAVMTRLYLSRLLTSPVPVFWHDELMGYLVRRWPVGDFMTAVLSNNLRESFRYADAESRASLCGLVTWLNWEVPAEVWGSPEKVARHLAGRVQP